MIIDSHTSCDGPQQCHIQEHIDSNRAMAGQSTLNAASEHLLVHQRCTNVHTWHASMHATPSTETATLCTLVEFTVHIWQVDLCASHTCVALAHHPHTYACCQGPKGTCMYACPIPCMHASTKGILFYVTFSTGTPHPPLPSSLPPLQPLRPPHEQVASGPHPLPGQPVGNTRVTNHQPQDVGSVALVDMHAMQLCTAAALPTAHQRGKECEKCD
jgi:hypothetical protein